MSKLRMVYLALAVIGAVLPLYQIGLWGAEHGLSLPVLLAAWKDNAATTALYWDLLFAGTVLSIWVWVETIVTRNWLALLAIPASFLIGLSCGLPLYLFLRTRPLD